MFRLSDTCSKKTFSVFAIGCIIVVSLLSFVISSLVANGILDVDDAKAVKGLTYIVVLVPMMLMSIKRLRDVNKSPWLTLVWLVPILNIALFFYLLSAKSTSP